MDMIAKGKNDVLAYLEEKARQKTGGQDGEYVLVQSDTGELIAIVAGHTFIGSGTVTLSGMQAQVNNGIWIDVKKQGA